MTKLLQSNPVGVYDSDDEDGFAISKEAYVRMNNYKSEYQSSHLSEQLEVKVSILTFYITIVRLPQTIHILHSNDNRG